MVTTEQKKEVQKTPQEIAGASAQPEVRKLETDSGQKTTGEKYYSAVKFITADVFILAATAALAYVARYGKESYAGIPNYLKKFQDMFHAKLLDNKILPLGSGKGEWGERLAAAAASTTILFHGGNAFIIPMKWFEDNKKKIVAYFNKKFGKEGEEEIGNERLQHTPKQSWGDIIKGRFSAWALVFTAFISFDFILGKGERSGMFYLDKYEEKFGRWLAGMTKGGKAIPKYAVTQDLPKELAHNTTYRFGKILALDIFATLASVLTWNFISALSAKKREKERLEILHELKNDTTSPASVAAPSSPVEAIDNTAVPIDQLHTETIQPRERITATPRKTSHSETYAATQGLEPNAAQVGI
jgi:hypothetical protein